jgi:hypothetical protein
MLATLGGEAAPVPGVGPLRIGRPLLPRVHIPGPGFGVVVDVTNWADGLRGGRLRKRFHRKGIIWWVTKQENCSIRSLKSSTK